MKIAIIGAGISGVSAGRILKEKGIESVLYEKSGRPGGLVQCDWVKGNLFHKVGGHVFNAKDKEVSDWFWSHFDRENEFIKAERNAKILLNGKLIGYPLENHLYTLPPEEVATIVNDLLSLQKNGYKDPYSYPHFSAFLKGNFGDTLYEIYFKPYNQKIWQTDLTTVPMNWLEGKLPMPDFNKIFLNNITRAGEKEMVHSTFYYPKKGGSQFIIDRLAEGLMIKADHPVEKFEYRNGKWTVNGEEAYDQIIYTGDVRMLGSIFHSGSIDSSTKSLLKYLMQLRSNGTSNMLCHTDPTDLSWLYLPDPQTKSHRIIYTGNFSPENNVRGARKTCVVEFSGKVYEAVMVEEIKSLPGNLTPIATNYEPNSYVIQSPDTRSKIEELKKAMAPAKFFLSGRFAEWEYYNMDKAIEAIIRLTKSNT